jgi:hypothetical protein
VSGSKWVRTDPGDPEAPRELAEYTTPAGDVLRPGIQAAYYGPIPLPGEHWRRIEALIDYGIPPVQAILDGGEYEVSADNLRLPGETDEQREARHAAQAVRAADRAAQEAAEAATTAAARRRRRRP